MQVLVYLLLAAVTLPHTHTHTHTHTGLEVIEAHYLFGTDYDDIDICIHPQSIIHSMIETQDSSVIAQVCVGEERGRESACLMSIQVCCGRQHNLYPGSCSTSC